MGLGSLLIAAAIVGCAPAPQSQAPNGVPSALMSHLTRGVNITRWFCYGDAHDTATFQNYLTTEDFDIFHRLGVRFVRLCISPEVIYRDGAPDATNLAFVDAAVDRLEKADLAVIVDLHDNGQMKLDDPDHDNSGFVRFWSSLAKHYRGRAETSTVFELLNEPIFQKNPEVWSKLQSKTVDAIRAVDPKRTILVNSTSWDGIDTLVKMKPLEAKNLIYSLHCYDPFVFTHQGATWAGDQQKALRNIPFPSSPDAVAQIIGQIPEPYQGAVRDYGEHRYDADYLKGRLTLAFDWGRQNRVPVLLGEFGAYPPVSPVESRARWFDGMRQAIKDLNLPNALWGYDDALGLGRSKSADGKIHLDPVCETHLYGS